SNTDIGRHLPHITVEVAQAGGQGHAYQSIQNEDSAPGNHVFRRNEGEVSNNQQNDPAAPAKQLKDNEAGVVGLELVGCHRVTALDWQVRKHARSRRAWLATTSGGSLLRQQ